MFDVSLVLALHREGPLLRRTLLSLREAVGHARAHGITVELVATLDRPDPTTCRVLKEFGADGFDGWFAVEVDYGSLGLSRNHGIEAARGGYVCTCDGDDLISYNSITAMFRLAETLGYECLIFPQYLYAFGQSYHCWEYFPIEAVTPLPFLETHPYISRAFARRSVFHNVRYADVAVAFGHAYEDWHFNATSIARGYPIEVAEDTILFYRQRHSSLMREAANRTTGQIPACVLFEPKTWLRITQPAHERLAPLNGAYPEMPGDTADHKMNTLATHCVFIQAANVIEPAIHPELFASAPCGSNMSGVSVAAGLAYYEVCQIVEAQHFDEVFLLPFIAKGGADRYVNDVMHALYAIRPTARMLVLLGEPLAGGSYVDRVPASATIVDLGNDWPGLTMRQRHLIALKLIQSTAPRARLHLRQAPFSEGFYQAFRAILRANPTVFYRFGDAREMRNGGTYVLPGSFNFLSEHVQDLALIVTDHQGIIAEDRNRIGICAEKWRHLPARQSMDVTEAEIVEHAARRRGRVLWASRLDRQKRPELLPGIARQVGQLMPDLNIDVFGSAVLDSFNPNCLAGLPNLSYRGPFDGLTSIDCSAYDAFLYTTRYDGMPNIILEAIAAGLPVVAPDIGGIGEIIVDGETGLLIAPLMDDDALETAYANALTRLSEEADLRTKLTAAAGRLLLQRHSPAAFGAASRAIFGGVIGESLAAHTLPAGARTPLREEAPACVDTFSG